ncbi:MAG: cupin domain-containing protein, partial [Anaerolineaceae bacterium]
MQSENSSHRQENRPPAEPLVGHRLRNLRTQRGYSLRALAEHSGLNVNTLSMIENGKTSPSVATLQQLGLALEVPITAFFQSTPQSLKIVYTPAEQRPHAAFGSTQMQNLGENLAGNAVQPFVVTLKPGTGSGDTMIVHTGHELVYGLSGSIQYHINEEMFIINPGDSLVFEAHLPHCWENTSSNEAQILLVLIPADVREEPGGHHFSPRLNKKEITMKIAFITDDGKSISQHFGRASYYLVLTVEEGKIVNREMRSKLGHNQLGGEHHEESHGASHGMDEAS